MGYLILIPLIVAILSYKYYNKVYYWIYSNTLGTVEEIQKSLDELFITVNKIYIKIGIILISFGLSAAVFFIFIKTIFFAAVITTITFIVSIKIPKLLIHFIKTQRIKKFSSQFLDALTLLSNSLKAGLSLPQALQITAQELPAPISQEFNLILSKQKIGVSLEEALSDLVNRINTEDVDMFVTAILILRETGGNLAETFDTIAYTIRARITMKEKISAMTRQGLIQGVVLLMMPFVITGIMYITNPSFIMPLFNTFLGNVAIAIVVVLEVIAAITIKNIISIKV